jgi:acyl dehydratase
VLMRRGNFHSDPAEARRRGLPGLVAQGLQVAAPAYGVLLDAWGEAFLVNGSIELSFASMVVDDQTVDAVVTFPDGDDDDGGDRAHGADTAPIEITNRPTGKVAVVGTASVSYESRTSGAPNG